MRTIDIDIGRDVLQKDIDLLRACLFDEKPIIQVDGTKIILTIPSFF